MPAPRPSHLDLLVDEALVPYRRLWPPHVLAAFREELVATLLMHPAARRLAAEARVDLDGPSGEVHLSGARGAEGRAVDGARRSGGK